MAVNSFNAQNPPVTTKGDLFTFSTIPTKLAVGSNGDTLVADSSTTTGLRYQTGVNRNFVINGGFDIWQRGTSFTNVVANNYTADRWACGNSPANTFSRQLSGLTAFEYCLRIQRTNGSTVVNPLTAAYNIETIDSIPLQGRTVTLSFYARRSSTASSSTLLVKWYSGTGTNQNLWFGAYTGQVTLADTSVTLTDSWQRFSFTATIATNATQVGFFTDWAPTGTAGASDFIEIAGFQLEYGSVATIFKRAGGTLAGELDACQRYYQQIINGNSQNIGAGWNYSSTYAMAILYAVNTMRTEPTISVTSGTNFYTFERNGGTDSVNGFFGAANANPNNTITLRNSTEISGTAGDAGLWFSNSASANISLSAEL